MRSNGPYKFHNLTDVHINGNGSTVICNNQEQAFSFYNCVRVELRDLTIDYDPLCFTQGEITAVAEDGSWFDVRIDEGYPVTVWPPTACSSTIRRHACSSATASPPTRATTPHSSSSVTTSSGPSRTERGAQASRSGIW